MYSNSKVDINVGPGHVLPNFKPDINPFNSTLVTHVVSSEPTITSSGRQMSNATDINASDTKQVLNLPQAPMEQRRHRAEKHKNPEPLSGESEDASITRQRNKTRKAAGFAPLPVQGKIRFK